jgi:DNA-binding transcriptional LysR family regulator
MIRRFIMHAMQLGGVDLNLLVVLDALLRERSVTRAARRIGLSQSATSHALGRLRALFDDELFVRGPRGLEETPRARELREPLAVAMAALERTLGAPEGFAPERARRRFVIGTADYGAFVVVPRLMAALAREAPGVDLLVRNEPELAAAVKRGELDAALVPPVQADLAGLHHHDLFDERFVCVLRRGHPALRGAFDLARFVELEHVLVAPRGTPGGVVDSILSERGLSRRAALALPHFMVAPYVVAATDLVITLAERIARHFALHLPLVLRAPPMPLPVFSMAVVWHARSEHDPAQRWFRDLLRRVVSELEGPVPPPRRLGASQRRRLG